MKGLGSTEDLIGLAIAIIITIVFVVKGIRRINEGEVGLVERFGKYRKTLKPGLHIFNFFIDKLRKVNMKIISIEVPGISVFTKDKIMVIIDSIVFYRITDPQIAVYAVDDLSRSIKYQTQLIIKDIIYGMDLEEAWTSREWINRELRDSLQKVVEPWGCAIFDCEIKDFVPPKDIKEKI